MKIVFLIVPVFFLSLYFISKPVHFDDLTLRKLREGRFYADRSAVDYSSREISVWTGKSSLDRALHRALEDNFPRPKKKSVRRRASESR